MYRDLTYKIIGCLFQVHNTLKNIWKEEVYEQALELELQKQGLQAECQKKFDVFYFNQQVGHYRIDILVENTIILELKAVSKVLPLHQAQLISYLKGYNKPIGILANFGEISLYHRTFPNKLEQKTPLKDSFDFTKIQLKEKEKIKDLLFMANRILVTLGAGYFPQVYRRAFYYELLIAGVHFELIKEMTANYLDRSLSLKEVNCFVIGDLLLSVIAVSIFDDLEMSKFHSYIHYFKCRRGLIFNFNAICLDYRYVEK